MHRRFLRARAIGILAVLLFLFPAVGIAQEERTDAGGLWTYVLEEGGATIVGCEEEPSGVLTIPGEVDGHAVTGIGGEAFSMCWDLTKVIIPDTVNSIGEWAFKECYELTGVIIGNSVTSIEEMAFFGCESLTSVIIPDSVTSIGSYAFADCLNLTRVTIPKSVTSIGDNAFSKADFLEADEQVTLCVEKGSYAEQYAQKHNIPLEDTEEENLVRLLCAANPSDLLVSFDVGDDIDPAMWVAGFAAWYNFDETNSDFDLFSEDAREHFAGLWDAYFDGWDLRDEAIPAPPDILPYSLDGSVSDSMYYRVENEIMQSLIKGIYGREMVDPQAHIRYYNGYFYFGHIGDYEERMWFGPDFTVDTVDDLLNGYYKIEGKAVFYNYADGEWEGTKAYEALVQKDATATYAYFLIAQQFSDTDEDWCEEEDVVALHEAGMRLTNG